MREYFEESGLFSEMDLQFARFVGRISGHSDRALSLAAALASRATGNGHVCLDLRTVAGQALDPESIPENPFSCPDLPAWLESLENADAVGRPGDDAPLILDEQHRLYLFRYWEYEHLLVERILEWTENDPDCPDEAYLKEGLDGLFRGQDASEPNWQEVACFTAAIRKFCVVSGGPGTGKSTVVSRILALLALFERGSAFRTALTAPTGKAAQRLQEAVRAGVGDLPLPSSIRETLPSEASTIHRLLGPVAGSPFFHHNAANPLAVDGVIVDEASMVDLPLMSKLVQALPSHARLILLGDQDQLASVEAGAVLGDLCDRGTPHFHGDAFCRRYHEITGQLIPGGAGPAVRDSLVRLEKNYRFGQTSGIGIVSRAVNRGDGDGAIEVLENGPQDDVHWVRLPDPQNLPAALKKAVVSGYRACLETHDPLQAFLELERFRILCAVRRGPFGVLSLNRIAEGILRAERLIRPEGLWYRGRPILILRNDYTLGLFNGDMGLILPDEDSGGDLRAFFRTQDGSLRKIHPARLPEHETVFAMTVHKSQGSEFEEVILLLPDQPSPVLTRELIYTGLTRARRKVAVWGRADVFVEGVSRRIVRSSGLRDALWKRNISGSSE